MNFFRLTPDMARNTVRPFAVQVLNEDFRHQSPDRYRKKPAGACTVLRVFLCRDAGSDWLRTAAVNSFMTGACGQEYRATAAESPVGE